ncbi:YIP1 family protein [Haloarcula amylovorans]|uniref:YIP1 family protein n=1 Tax=Haloarcula amylovorans TaxID=2562280 RepID=UPI001075D202|nr:YIP1 family protein [Halomicroarcula amylolytica]
MNRQVVDLVTSPNEFFARERRDPALLGPAVVVALAGVFVGINSLVLVPLRSQGVSGEAMVYLYAGVAFGWITTILTMFLLWIFYAGAFFTVATYLFDGSGDFRKLLKLAGWGFVGQIAASVVSVMAKGIIYTQIDPAAGAVVAQIQTHPLFTVASTVSMVGFFWSMWLWSYAIRYSLHLSLIRSLVAVVVPVVISAGLFFVTRLFPGMS